MIDKAARAQAWRDKRAAREAKQLAQDEAALARRKAKCLLPMPKFYDRQEIIREALRTMSAANKARIKELRLKARDLFQKTWIEHQVDHIVPLALGGKHHPDNMQIITANQNSRKGWREKEAPPHKPSKYEMRAPAAPLPQATVDIFA